MLRWFPALTLVLFLGPVAAGLVGTWAPAFGYLPSLGGSGFSFDPWRQLFAQPGLGKSLALSLGTGFAATLISLGIVLGFLASCHGRRPVVLVRRLLAPLLAVPHVAVAIGFAFLPRPAAGRHGWYRPGRRAGIGRPISPPRRTPSASHWSAG